MDNHKGLKENQVRAGLNDKSYLLHENIPSRLEEVAVLSNTWKPTQRVKKNKETDEYVPNKRTR